MIEHAVQALRDNNFIVHVFKDKKSACNFLLDQVQPGMSVSVGGSMTLDQIGLIDKLTELDISFFNQYQEGLSREESLEIRRLGLLADVFFSGSNAVSEQGEVINIDGVGNRVAAFSYGPKKVFITVGKNKVVPDRNEAIERIRNHAAPLNARRLQRNTPCTVDGKCHDCTSDERICNIVHILQKQLPSQRIEIVFIEEDLGL